MPGGGNGTMNMARWAQQWRQPGGAIQQVCAVALAATGTFALASLIPFLAAGRPSTAPFPLNVVYAPAWFLFDSFLWFALLIPVLCYVYVIVLYNDRVTREVMASLVAVGLFLPVLGALSHVLLGEDGAFAAVALIEAFGRVPAAILLILVLMLESVAFFALLKHWRERAHRLASEQPRHEVADSEDDHDPVPAADAAPRFANGAAQPYANGVPQSHVNGAGHGYVNGAPPPPAGAGAVHGVDEMGQHGDGGGITDQPKLVADQPELVTDQPKLVADQPELVTDQPKLVADQPELVTDQPEPVPDQPETVPDQPEPITNQQGLTADGRAPGDYGGPPIVNGVPPAVHALPDEPTENQPRMAEPKASAGSILDVPRPDVALGAGGADGEPNPVAYVVPADGEAQANPAPGPAPTAKPRSRRRGYQVPLDVLDEHESDEPWQVEHDTREAAATLMTTLAEFRIDAEVTGVRRGPVITMFEILPAPGVKISRIVNLADNIALRLAASRVRIVAPIPGKHAVGIEVPNRRRTVVGFRDLVSQKEFRPAPRKLADGVPIALGKDITGEAQVIDLTATPHLLIAGATGAGKSVLVNSLICSILYSRTPEQVRLLLIDPKIVELKLYNDVPHLLTPVITDPKRAFQALQYCLYEMERRYALLDNLGVRDIRSYNRKLTERDDRLTLGPLPYLVIVIDEFADLMATTGKELEATLARLAAMARAVGIHIVLATQRPSIDVITGLIKANIPSRIAFMVASKFDSRIIIDAVGAEKLLGRGDMLFVPAWDANPLRIQGALVSEEEVERVTEKVRELGEPDYIDEDILFDDEESELVLEPGAGDPMMEQALEIVAGAGKASASYLQRKLKIGYNRAARLVEEMEQRGIVGPANGSKPREILHLPNRDSG